MLETECMYQESANICGKVFKELKKDILENNICDVKSLCKKGDELIVKELSLVYKKITDKNVAFPVSISLDNCIGNYVWDTNTDFNTIKDDSVIKVELGVHISGCTSILCETFTIGKNEMVEKVNHFLSELQKDIVERICHEETSDEIRIMIESECTECGMFPVQNCTSYQQERGYFKTMDSKYMILNHKAFYDNEDNLITEQNINYEFEKDDVYTINLTVIPYDTEEKIKYKKDEDSHIFYLTDSTYSLKLKSSRALYNEIKRDHGNSCFLISDYSDTMQRLGTRECIKNKLLEKLPIFYVNKNIPVISKKFTILVDKEKSKIVKYNL